MIHIATVHWGDDRWIDIQLKYLNKNIKSPFKTYAFLNGLPKDHSSKYFYSSSEIIESHAIKLNLLADIVSFNSVNNSDLIMFLDGDAFPIADIVSFWELHSSSYQIIAVQRRENNGDIQPHPCFCITTIGFWKELKGDWKHGYIWNDSNGNPITDVGGNMLKLLSDLNVPWKPLLRSNKQELHPLWFGLYEDIVYHHGAAFRDPTSRADVAALNSFDRLCFNLLKKLPTQIRKFIPNQYQPLYKIAKNNKELSENVFKTIQSDPEFFRYFMK